MPRGWGDSWGFRMGRTRRCATTNHTRHVGDGQRAVLRLVLLYTLVLICLFVHDNAHAQSDWQTFITEADMQPGDIVLARRDLATCRPLNYKCQAFRLFDGYWLHTGIVVTGPDGTLHLAEATPERNVSVLPLEQAMSSFSFSREFALLRVDAPPEVRQAAADYALAQQGKLFSEAYWDKGRTDGYYCSQLVWAAYLHAGVDLDSNYLLSDPAFMARYAGSWVTLSGAVAALRVIVTPDDFLHSPHTVVVLTS